MTEEMMGVLAFLNVITKIVSPSNVAKKYLDDISVRIQKCSASAQIYRCNISPESIRVSFIYIFPKKGIV
jgi:hypothetical protein